MFLRLMQTWLYLVVSLSKVINQRKSWTPWEQPLKNGSRLTVKQVNEWFSLSATFIEKFLALDFVNDDQWSWIYYKMLNQKNHMMFFSAHPINLLHIGGNSDQNLLTYILVNHYHPSQHFSQFWSLTNRAKSIIQWKSGTQQY